MLDKTYDRSCSLKKSRSSYLANFGHLVESHYCVGSRIVGSCESIDSNDLIGNATAGA